jgi:phenylacetate-CoA ligase
MIENLEGRLDDYILTPEGRYVTGLSLLFKESPFVREAQIEQDHPEAIVIRVVRQAGYGKHDEQRIRAEAHRRLGSAIRIHCEYVDRIPREPGGKFRFIKSRLPAPVHNANSLGNPIGVASDETPR